MAEFRWRQRSLPPLLVLAVSLLLVTRNLPQQCRASEPAVQSSDGGLLPEELAELEDLDDLDDFELLSRKLSQADLLDSDEEAALDWDDEEEQDSDLDVGEEEEGEEEDEEEEDEDGAGYEEDLPANEKDVVVLTASNFTKFVESHPYVLVEFYAPWCGHCMSLAPQFADAATELKGEAALAKVDATVHEELAEKYDVQGYPTLLFFVDGGSKPYTGHRHRQEIVKWVKKKIGPAAVNISSVEQAKSILRDEKVVVVALLESLVGAEADELASAARQVDGVFFGQTTDPEVARVFELEEGAKAPALVLLKKEKEKVNHLVFEEKLERNKIVGFVQDNRLPLVITFSAETSSSIFDSDIKKQVLWFVASSEYEELLPHFEAAAKEFKGKIIFVHVNGSDQEISAPVKEFFGVADDKTTVIAFQAEDGGKKYRLEGEITSESVKGFVSDFFFERLKPFLKSDSIPEVNDGDVKIVVGLNFDEIVLDETKDVLLELYAPWCGHCEALEPIYEKLAKRLKGVDSLVIAKMDGTTNEHYRARPDGFPTILFFPAGNKSFDPIIVDAERTVKAFAQFLKKHAAIPFTIPKIAPKVDTTAADKAESQGVEQVVSKDVEQPKDEL